MEQNYITILVQSLEKKQQVLEKISQENCRQKQILQAEELDMDAFEETVSQKAECIKQIDALDSGFEKVYERVKDVLNNEKHQYKEEIVTLKQLISEITELTVLIQRNERENHKLAETKFLNEQKKVRQVKASKQAATKYYQNMTKLNLIEPQFMDKKK